MTPQYIHAERAPHSVVFLVASVELAVDVAAWLEAQGWRCRIQSEPGRTPTLEEQAVIGALFREYCGAR